MARTWAELLGEDGAAPAEEARDREGFFSRLRDSLGKSRRALTEQIAAAAFDPQDEAAWERLEEALIAGDVGVRATAELVRRLEARGDVGDLNAALAEEIAAGPTFANTMTKRMLAMEWAMSVEEAIEAEAVAQALCMTTEDFARAYRAFVARTRPVFEGD